MDMHWKESTERAQVTWGLRKLFQGKVGFGKTKKKIESISAPN